MAHGAAAQLTRSSVAASMYDAVPSRGSAVRLTVTPGPKTIGAPANVSLASTLMGCGAAQVTAGAGEQSSNMVTMSLLAMGTNEIGAARPVSVWKSATPPRLDSTRSVAGAGSPVEVMVPAASAPKSTRVNVACGTIRLSLETAFTVRVIADGS